MIKTDFTLFYQNLSQTYLVVLLHSIWPDQKETEFINTQDEIIGTHQHFYYPFHTINLLNQFYYQNRKIRHFDILSINAHTTNVSRNLLSK